MAPTVTQVRDSRAASWLTLVAITVAVGIGSGLGGMGLGLSLRIIQHAAYSYALHEIVSTESFLQGVLLLHLCAASWRYGFAELWPALTGSPCIDLAVLWSPLPRQLGKKDGECLFCLQRCMISCRSSRWLWGLRLAEKLRREKLALCSRHGSLNEHT